MSVREQEREWLGSKIKEKRPVPSAVRAMWFLSSVLVNWRRLYSRDLRKAIGEKGTEADVEVALRTLIGVGRTAEKLLEEMTS